MAENLEKLFEEIQTTFDTFIEDASKYMQKGNALAGRRSRKASMAITALLKEWRKMSVNS